MTIALEELLDADRTNVESARQVVRQLDPSILNLFDDAAAMYTTFCRCIEFSEPFIAQHTCELSRIAHEFQITPDELLKRIVSDEALPELDAARAAWKLIRVNTTRAIVVLACQRQFMWGVTDLLRTRVTPAFGYTRQQAESVALLHLFRDNPNAAVQWRQVSTANEGRRFYRAYQPQLNTIMEAISLAAAYEQGSGAALHVRLASVARALFSLGPEEAPHSSGGAIRLAFQELDPTRPFRYFLAVLHFLYTQARVFEGLTAAFPEVYDPIWSERVRRFGVDVGMVRERIRNAYPDQVRELEADSAPQ